MWKRIDSLEVADALKIGDLITEDPGNTEDFYRIQYIHTGYVKIIHANGKTIVKVFPEEQLVRDEWYVKEK